MWSGLGYYSRGRRLLEGAQKVCFIMSNLDESVANDVMEEAIIFHQFLLKPLRPPKPLRPLLNLYDLY